MSNQSSSDDSGDADYDRPLYVTERLRYFDGEFLDTQAFIDEQNYHVDRRVRHEATLHVAGILEGLVVEKAVDANGAEKPLKVTVSQGSALDDAGNQILLWNPDDKSGVSPQKFELTAPSKGVTYCVDVLFAEPPQTTSGSSATRFSQDYTQVVQINETQRAGSVLIAVVTTDSEGAVTIGSCGARQGNALYAGHHLPGPDGQGATLRVGNIKSDLTQAPNYKVILDRNLYLDKSSVEIDGELIFLQSSQIFAGGYDQRILLQNHGVELQAGKQIILSANMSSNTDNQWISTCSVVVNQSGDVGIGTGGTTTSGMANGNPVSARLEIKGDGTKGPLQVTSSGGAPLLQVDDAGNTSVAGTLTAATGLTLTSGVLTFPVIPTTDGNDPSPIITSRMIPANQCGGSNSTNPSSNDQQRSELIAFHCNDGFNAYGPDFITLRAPAIRLQTYNGGVTSIADANGSRDRLYIDPNGKVGIGTDTATQTDNSYPNKPSAQLDVKAASGNVGLNVTGAGGQVGLQVKSSTGSSVLQTQDSGVTVPNGTLAVSNGLLTASKGLSVNGASDAAALVTRSASGQAGLQVVASNGSTSLQVLDTGRVGIGLGTTAPGAALEVKAASSTVGLKVDGSSAAALVVTSASGQAGLQVNGSSGTTLLQVLDTGRVGIGLGTTAPGALLDVSAPSSTVGLRVTGSGATSLVVKGASGQTALQVIGSSGTNVLTVADSGLTIVSGALTFPATTSLVSGQGGDPGPTITSRLIPATQCGGTNVTNTSGNDQERSELILFNSNDGDTNGYGPDFITLRAPAIRLQTYNGGVTSISDDNGSKDRLYIDPSGKVGIGTATAALTDHSYPNKPSAQLDVKAASGNVALSVTGASGKVGLQVQSSTGSSLLQVQDSGVTVPNGTLTVSNGLLTASKGLTVSGAVSMMGSWREMSRDTTYRASTDGFVMARLEWSSNGDTGTITGYSDDLNTAKAYASIHHQTSGTDIKVDANSFLMPVKNGTQWKVVSSGAGSQTVWWMPLGTDAS